MTGPAAGRGRPSVFPYEHLTGPHEADEHDRPGVPSGTVLRFALLAVTMLTATLDMTNTVGSLLFSDAADRAGLGCWFAVGDDSAFWRDALTGGRAGSPLADPCLTERVGGRPYGWGYAGAAALLAVAAVVHRLQPRLRTRRRGLIAVEDIGPSFDSVGLRAELDELVTLAARVEHVGSLDSRYLELTPPRFVVDCTALDASAVVFGRSRHPVVCLHAGLLAVRGTAPERFRAVVLHELAHIRTMDVGLAYSVLALWRSFLAVVLLPYAVIVGGGFVWAAFAGYFPGLDQRFWPAALPELARQAAKAVLLVTAVVLIRADTLRHRELVADTDAVAAGADVRVWEAAARAEAEAAAAGGRRDDPATGSPAGIRGPGGGGGGSRCWSRVWVGALPALLRLHPDWQQRLRALHRPYTLYGVGSLQYFLIGCTAMTSVHTVERIWGGGLASSTVSLIASAILFFAIWHDLLRARFAGIRQDLGPAPAPGLAFGGGLLVGQFLAGVGHTSRWWPANGEAPAVLLFLPLAGALWVAWVGQTSHLCLLQGARPRAAIWFTSLFILFGVGLFQWWTTHGFTAVAGDPFDSLLASPAAEMPGLADAHPGTYAVAAAVIRFVGTPVTGRSQAFLATVLWFFAVLVQLPRIYGKDARRRARTTAMRAEGAGFGGVAGTGLVCGLAACAALVTVLVTADAFQPGSGPSDTVRRSLLVWWPAMAAWAGAALAAAVATVRLGPLWLPRALVAAAVAQTTVLLGFLCLLTFGGCAGGRLAPAVSAGCGRPSPELGRILPLLSETVFLGGLAGALAAVPTALLCHTVRRVARHRLRPRLRPRHTTVGASAARSWAVRAGVGLLLVTTVGSCDAGQRAAGDPSLVLTEYRASPVGESTADRIRLLQLSAWERAESPELYSHVLSYHSLVAETLSSRPDDLVAARARCSALRDAADRALSARPFPDRDLRTRWSDLLHRTRAAAAACTAGLHAPSPERPWEAGLAAVRAELIDLRTEQQDRLTAATLRTY
ncbi:M48 family metalloprotease [Streptomyces sp. NPDC059851]|uniref:M48 family metalloprotease n=1 Tax=Streptomyces sp. NPDC059851 TaxID=3346971 RepID=UPI00365E72F9